MKQLREDLTLILCGLVIGHAIVHVVELLHP